MISGFIITPDIAPLIFQGCSCRLTSLEKKKTDITENSPTKERSTPKLGGMNITARPDSNSY